MKKTYKEIVSVVNGDIELLEDAIVADICFPEDTLKKLLLAPAKRIRPALSFLFLRANGLEVTQEQLNVLVAVELAHTASLIHDDIIDLSQSRRGLETLNNLYSDKTAVLTGDYVLCIALKKLLSTENYQIINKFLDTFSQMATGEISQYFTKYTIPTLENYIEKTIKKTASLFDVALTSSAILTNANVKIWSEFALNFGIAFQIKNDLDNILTDNSDTLNGVYTAPVIFANSTEIKEDSIKKTKDLINYYINKAEIALNSVATNKYSQALREILELYKYD